MDTRRLNTDEIEALGIRKKPAPDVGPPEGTREVSVYRYASGRQSCSKENVARLLDAGVAVECTEDHGIPLVWREGDGYRGALFQYRSVTEDREFTTAADAAKWFVKTANAVAG